MVLMLSMKNWMDEMSEDKDAKILRLEKALNDIDASVEEAMGETLIGARALMSLRWARKLIAKALGKEED